MSTTFNSHGKLLITGEYVVLDQALGLALPTKLGQSLKRTPIEGETWHWKSLLHNGEVWQELSFTTSDIIEFNLSNPQLDFKARVLQLLQAVYQLKSPVNILTSAFCIETVLEFPKDWGLGSSSTLIANLAKAFKVNAYALLEKSFGGSGYDIACASAQSPIIYQRNGYLPHVRPVELKSNIIKHLFFVYRNQKQNSREAITHYRNTPKPQLEDTIVELNKMTVMMTSVDTLMSFEKLLMRHEALIGRLIQQEPIQQELFSDYTQGVVKSLGAWGGDFMLVTASTKEDLDYFRARGFSTIKSYSEFIV